MRLRDMTSADYGITPDEEAEILARMKRLSPDEKVILFKHCVFDAPGLEYQIYTSLTYGDGFYKLRRKMDMPVEKSDDFYAYRKKVLARTYYELCDKSFWKMGGTEHSEAK